MKKQLLLALSLMVTINVLSQPKDIVVHLVEKKTGVITSEELGSLKNKSATIQNMFEDIPDESGELHLPDIKYSSLKLFIHMHDKKGKALCSDLKKLHEKQIQDLMQTANYFETEELLDASSEEFAQHVFGDNHTKQLFTQDGYDTYYQNLGLLTELQGKVAQQFVKTKIALSFKELAKKPIREFKHKGLISSVAFDLIGQYIVTGSRDKKACIFSIKTGEKLHQFGHGESIASVAFDPTGKSIATGSYDGKSRIFTIETGEKLQEFDYGTGAVSVAFDPTGQYFAATGPHDAVHIFNSATGEMLKEFGHGNTVSSVAFNSTGTCIATGNYDCKVRIIDIKTGVELQQFDPGFPVWSVAFDPTGCYLAVGLMDKGACIFAIETGEKLQQFDHGGKMHSVAFDPTGKYFATGTSYPDNKVYIFDVETGEKLQQFDHGSSVWSIAFDPTGKYIATGSFDNKVRIWTIMSMFEKAMQNLTFRQAQLVTLLITKKILLNALPEHMEKLYKDLPEMIRDLLEAQKPGGGISKYIGDACRNLIQKIKGTGYSVLKTSE